MSHLDEMVITIDKIGSGFEERENTALALLLFFRENDILNKLAAARKTLSHSLSEKIGSYEYDKWIENDIILWRPPYDKNKYEITELLNRLDKQT
ncbi:hypothetical protein [Pseudomonas abieticivorans]|uniref:hypothetical protein n=1 Tax=Pseudomonas abieticivorans TaxID=2931382 RepID=UPI0020C09949|nr:hypothetical protein [Pseudomonas sp. PIA16]